MARVRFRARKRIPVLPFLRANVDLSSFPPRLTSWTWHALGWSYNTHTRAHAVNTPGPGGLQITPDRPRRRSAR
jgi:hypothetical protein